MIGKTWYFRQRCFFFCIVFFLFQAEDGIRDLVRSRGLGDVYKRQPNVSGGGNNWMKWLLPLLLAAAVLYYFSTKGCGNKVVESTTEMVEDAGDMAKEVMDCLLYTSPSPRDRTRSRMPSSA